MMQEIKPAPKPGPKKKGRSFSRSKAMSEAALARDGFCLYGLMFQEHCSGRLDPHHITSFGADPTKDVLENLITLCRLHHNQAEERKISPVVLQGILYHFYGYGPPEAIATTLDDIVDICARYGLVPMFNFTDTIVEIVARGFVSRAIVRVQYTQLDQSDDTLVFLNEIEMSILEQIRRKDA